jgi:hypothetical protein
MDYIVRSFLDGNVALIILLDPNRPEGLVTDSPQLRIILG